MCSAMSKELEGSCSAAATALGLSPLATLAFRLALTILRRITLRNADQSLVVNMSSLKLTIRVSRHRRSTSRRKKETGCTVDPASGSMAITSASTGQPPLAALSSTAPLGSPSAPRLDDLLTYLS